MGKKRKCCNCACVNLKCCAWFNLIMGAVIISLGIVLPFLLGKAVNFLVKQSILMQEGNKDQWAFLPGLTGVQMIRNFTFYNFTNDFQVLFYNQTPVFIETGPYKYNEYQNFTDRIYDYDYDIVNFNFWQYFSAEDGTTGDEVVKIINLGPLGAWYQMKTANESQIALSALSQLFYGMNDAIKISILAQGVQEMLFSNQTTANKIILSQLANGNLALQEALWSDPNFGVGSLNTLPIWITAFLEYKQTKGESGALQMIQTYFILNNTQMYLMFQQLDPVIQLVNQTVIQGYYCVNYTDYLCNDRLFSAIQWTTQGITNNPPAGSTPTPSITSTNFTAVGFPELSYFLKNYLIANNPNMSIYENVTFSLDWALEVMNYYNDPLKPNQYIKKANALLNIGNLNYLFNCGYLYDSTNDTQYLKNITDRFKLHDQNQTIVFWLYMKYMVREFAEQQSLGGNSGVAALGGVLGATMYQSFVALQNYLLPNITSMIVMKNLTNQNINTCTKFFIQAINGLTNVESENICELKQFINWDSQSINMLVFYFYYPYSLQVKQFQIQAQLSPNQISYLLDPSNFFGQIAFNVSLDLLQHYGCQEFSWRCSNYEIAIMQWATGNITYSLPTQLQGIYNQSWTAYDWNQDLFPSPWEYGYWANTNYTVYRYQNASSMFFPNYTEASLLLSFNNIFSGSLISSGFLWAKNNSLRQKFQQTFFFDTPYQLIQYLRYVAIYIGFGGFTQQRPIKQLLFGYVDPFANQLKTMNPQLGGDPSINAVIMLNDPNVTYDQRYYWSQSMHTGKNNISQVRYYEQVYGKTYAAFNRSYFDGENVYYDFFSPWAEEVPIVGTDAAQNLPFQSTSGPSLNIYITDLYKGGNAIPASDTSDYYGVTTIKYTVDPCFLNNAYSCPQNAVYYAFGPNGLHNLSSIMGAPVFNSKTHFYQGDPILYQSIIVWSDASKTNQVQPQPMDDTWLSCEVNSGTTMQVVLNLQGNYQLAQDDLFNSGQQVYLPMFYLYRSGNFSEDKVNELFGSLKDGQLAQLIILIVLCCIGGLEVIFSVYLGIKFYRNKKKLKMGILIDNYNDSDLSNNQSDLDQRLHINKSLTEQKNIVQ